MTDDPRTVSDEAIEACLEYEREHWPDNQGSTAYWTGLLLAASREIVCPECYGMQHTPYNCSACGGSGRLRVLL